MPPLPLGSLNLFPARHTRHTPSPAPQRADVGAQAWEVQTHQEFKVLLGYIGSWRRLGYVRPCLQKRGQAVCLRGSHL